MAFPLLIDRYSSELMQYMRLCCLLPADGPLESHQYNLPISSSNERAALNALRDGCLAALQEYPQTEAEDAESRAARLAKERHGEQQRRRA